MEILSVLQETRMFRTARELILPDGSTILNQFVFPKDTLEWRAAEYQIDPRETDLLLDIVLYESIMPQDPQTIPVLYTADSVDEAREIYVQQVLDFKHQIRPVARAWKNQAQRSTRMKQNGLHPVWSQNLTDDALLPIRTGATLDHGVIVEKSRFVMDSRDKARRLKEQIPTPRNRAEMFRDMRLSGKRAAPKMTGEVNG